MFDCRFSQVTQNQIKGASRRSTVSVMDSCLSSDLILSRIISKLNLREKFSAQGVCQRWKDTAIQCLRHHEYLVISGNPPSHFGYYDCCKYHLFRKTVSKENLIWGKQIDLEFWQRTLSLLQGVKFVYIDVKFGGKDGPLFSVYKPILQLLIDSCGQSLECLRIPRHNDEEDETFPLTDSLPSLKHMIIGYATSQVTKNILTACPNLEYLRSITSFTEWQMLPKGFKKLYNYFEDFDGIFNLLSSPAVQSLEVISNIVMTSEICYQPYHFSSLKKFEVTINFDITRCLRHLARILSFAPVLRELIIFITVLDEIEPQVWIKVLSECQNLINLAVHLHKPTGTENPLINVSTWQDHFARTIVSKMKNLTHLNIGFHLSSQGLRSIAQLQNLEYFYHVVHTENMSYESVFDTDALVYFLSEALSKKLTSYRIYIPTAEFYGEYLILKESFLDFVYKMEQQYFVRFYVCQDDRHFDTERPHPEKIPGMIYVTDIYLKEWHLLRPYMYSDDDKEEEEENDNLLVSLMATQSYVQNILLESDQK